MALAEPPIELGAITLDAGSRTLALTVTVIVPIGALVYVVAGVSHTGAAPIGWTDPRGNVYALCGSAVPGNGTLVYTFA